jgi:hypothetical protein
MNPSRKSLDLARRFREDGISITVPEFVECLDECIVGLAFPVGDDTLYHIVATLNADYIAALGETDTPPESTDEIVYVYHMYKQQWVGVPVAKLVTFTVKDFSKEQIES